MVQLNDVEMATSDCVHDTNEVASGDIATSLMDHVTVLLMEPATLEVVIMIVNVSPANTAFGSITSIANVLLAAATVNTNGVTIVVELVTSTR
jgi:hypothetical protein